MVAQNARESQIIPVRQENIDDDTEVQRSTRKSARNEPSKVQSEPKVKIDKPIPTEGWPALKYKVDQITRRMVSFYDPEIPDMNKAERKKYKFSLQLKRIETLIERLKFLTVKNERIIAILNSKGGAGKTPILAYLSCIHKKVTEEPVIFIDANENVGTAHLWFGIERSLTLLLQEAVLERQQLTSYSRIARKGAAKHLQSSTRFIGSNRKRGKPFDSNQFIEMVRIVNESFNSTYLDTGNGFDSQSNIGTVEIANALLFPIIANNPGTYNGLVLSMQNYIEEGHGEKVRNGFIVVNATQPGDTKEKFLDIIRTELTKHPVPTYNEVTRITRDIIPTLDDFGIDPDRLFMIPYSEYIAAPQINVITTDPSEIGYDTYEAMLNLLVAIFEQNAVYDPRNNVQSIESTSMPISVPATIVEGTTY